MLMKSTFDAANGNESRSFTQKRNFTLLTDYCGDGGGGGGGAGYVESSVKGGTLVSKKVVRGTKFISSTINLENRKPTSGG
ncbi:hypothetical protein M0802_004363 [Mischocyttarus mexicanus]|nr:hypothetical protein M0802_004363 [Mischocyttarus mexicanus]